MTHALHRREFLAVASCAALAPAAAAGRADDAEPGPNVATLVPCGFGTDSEAKHARFSQRSPMNLSQKSCVLTIETIGDCACEAGYGADLEVLYPAAGAAHLAWSASQGQCPAPLTTLAPIDALGRVKLRGTVRGAGDPVGREFMIPSTPGTHVIALPMAAGAKRPAWRRCVATMSGGRIETIQDPWRPSAVAPGCTLVRVTLIEIEPESNPNHIHSTEHSDAK